MADRNAARQMIDLAKEAGLTPQSMDISTSAGRAYMRLRAEKERHQESRENVGYFALLERQLLLSEGTNENDSIEIEPEWLHRFWRLAQDINSEDLQSLWGRILARKAAGIGGISGRTLEALSLLEGWEVEQFTRVAQFAARIGDSGSAWLITGIAPSGELQPH